MAVALALGFDPKDEKTPYYVRIGWQTQGQPGFLITEDVAFVRAQPEDEPTTDRQVDVVYSIPDDTGSNVRTTKYMQTWRAIFTFYGPSCVDNAYAVRRAIVAAEVHDQLAITLAQYGLYFVPDIAPPAYVPE